MGWLSSLFSSSDSSQYSRKGQALSSTHEAFSLPTSSPTFHSHPDAFNPAAFNNPEFDAIAPAYTYPPQDTSAYGSVPVSTGLNSRPASAYLLPIHHDPTHTPLSPKLSYPPLSSTWNRLRTWLDREYPELGDTLNYGIPPHDLAQIEMQFGFPLPPVVRESYLCVDGQEAESAAGCSEGLFFGLKLLPLEDVLDEWRFWREVDDDPTTGANPHLREAMQSIPPGWVRKDYSQRGWIPVIADKAGNYVGIDLNPDEKGSVGQVIVFGRDFDTKVVLWRGDGLTGWAKWFASFVDDLEGGEGIELGAANEGSEDSEDDVGYEGYFYDGTGRGQGDGGGDTGSGGGLRLAGEYRGWNVLEAWADRSLRRWHEVGVITDTSLIPSEEQTKTPAPIDKIQHDSSTAIGTPVLSDDDDSTPVPTSSALGTPDSKSLSRPIRNAPTVSVAKGPAPRPVELPLLHDIVPLPDSPPSSFDEDLESGRSSGMLSVVRDSPDSLPRRPEPQAHAIHDSEIKNSGGTLLGVSVPVVTRSYSGSSVRVEVRPTAPKPDVPDLMADSVPVMDTKPITPLLPAPIHSSEPATLAPVPRTEIVEAQGAAPEQEGAVKPDTTIRLVGGGGVMGIVSGIRTEEPEPIDNIKEKEIDVMPNNPMAPEAAALKDGKTHRKTMSGFSGLKKLRNLPRPRKKDSNSSIKSTAASTPS